ncbi:hypothetical protein V1512DRAFT_259836 [Lipomyces arxii]|uniref:uncharacterized protein n=1 Tax=Lipomyces arxii TaxID=56418 RepID=UPI0034CD98C6
MILRSHFRPQLQSKLLFNFARLYHNSLESFLVHAKSTGLATQSTYYVGTLYEYVVQRALATSANMDLEHSGGAGDNGIDLRGSMPVPNAHKSIPVIVQCKFENKNPGVRYVRELDGCLTSYSKITLGILAGPLPVTVAAKRALAASHNAMAFCLVTGYDQGGLATQMIWNAAAQRLLQGLKVVTVHREIKNEGKRELIQSVAIVNTL